MKNNMQCVRRIQFCSGHRVLNHESKCANAHGHNYVVFFHAISADLDDIGRVIDFSVLKEKLGGWIDTYWDHTFLINEKDTELLAIKDVLQKNKDVFICPFNPTAENMASYLLNEVCPKELAGTPVKITKIELWETENCKVEVTLD
jgi:6-pyruvoyltetrahydropterin/6-carboxytetrahydropterin synthase